MLSGTPEGLKSAKKFIIGVDEAGRGPLAGPVVACAVVLGNSVCGGSAPDGLADSKVLSAKRRAALDLQIRESCAWAVGVIEPAQIDEINILQATFEAMTQAVVRLCAMFEGAPSEILIDGNMTPAGKREGWREEWVRPARAIIGGDGIEPAISAASIVAKEWRDRFMIEAAQMHPQYGWESNKGYGSKAHMAALREFGPTPLHRRSFAPVAQLTLI